MFINPDMTKDAEDDRKTPVIVPESQPNLHKYIDPRSTGIQGIQGIDRYAPGHQDPSAHPPWSPYNPYGHRGYPAPPAPPYMFEYGYEYNRSPYYRGGYYGHPRSPNYSESQEDERLTAKTRKSATAVKNDGNFFCSSLNSKLFTVAELFKFSRLYIY